MGRYTNKQIQLDLARDILAYVSDRDNAARPTMPVGYTIPQPNGQDSKWLIAWRKFETFLDTGLPQWNIFKLDGNSKLNKSQQTGEFIVFSSLPLFTCPGAGDCLNWCYSFKSWRYPDAFFRQLQNTILLMTSHGRKTIRRVFYGLPYGREFRLYVDGDFDSEETLGFWFNLLASRPDLNCYGYSKSWKLLIDWDNSGRPFPANYALNASSGSKYNQLMLERIKLLSCYRGTFDALPVSFKMPDRRKQAERFNVWASELRKTALDLGYGKVWVCPGQCGDCTPIGHACGSRKFQNVPVVIGLH